MSLKKKNFILLPLFAWLSFENKGEPNFGYRAEDNIP